MIDALIHILVFVVEVVVLALAIVFVLASIIGLSAKAKAQNKVSVKNLNEHFNELSQTVLSEADKPAKKQHKKAAKKAKKNPPKHTLFVVDFSGDIRASQSTALRQEISTVLLAAKKGDEVFIRLESPGGLVNAYGFAASQLQRVKDAGLKLTVAVDQVAASGGYMMACVADRIIAAPFAIIGSIGVILQMPNFNKWLKKHDIDFEQLSAGEYKRTLTLLGENTTEKREKMQHDIDATHDLFKQHVADHRPNLDISKVATGEYWYGKRALELGLVDELKTSDDFLLAARQHWQLRLVKLHSKRGFMQRLRQGAETLLATQQTAP